MRVLKAAGGIACIVAALNWLLYGLNYGTNTAIGINVIVLPIFALAVVAAWLFTEAGL